jgi:hypothetical protein
MFSYHHPVVSTPGLTQGGTSQGSGEEQKREWGKGNPEAAIVIKNGMVVKTNSQLDKHRVNN